MDPASRSDSIASEAVSANSPEGNFWIGTLAFSQSLASWSCPERVRNAGWWAVRFSVERRRT